MADMGDKARDEFFSEAHEIIEGLSRDLLQLDDSRHKGPAEPELVNIELTQHVVALLFRGISIYQRILAVEKGLRQDPLDDMDNFIRELGALSDAGAMAEPAPAARYELDPGLLAVLTEYEEHRLRTNIEQGQSLFRLRVAFELPTIDEALNNPNLRAKPHAEIITSLPTGAAPC